MTAGAPIACRWCGAENDALRKECEACHGPIVPPAKIPRERMAISHTASWGALEAFVGKERCSEFMYMCTLEGEGVRIHLYKHYATRRYLNLGEDGTPYRFDEDAYEEIPAEQALRHALS